MQMRTFHSRLSPPRASRPTLLSLTEPHQRHVWQLYFYRFPSYSRDFRQYLVDEALDKRYPAMVNDVLNAWSKEDMTAAISKLERVWAKFKHQDTVE